jgi:hypothetical protein
MWVCIHFFIVDCVGKSCFYLLLAGLEDLIDGY